MTERAAAKGRPSALSHAALGAVVALVPASFLWGFTVDDALIPARYAAHLAAGEGYRFSASGASTDGVTPLGFAHMVAPFASGGPLAALEAQKLIGLVAWVIAAAALAVAIGRVSEKPQRWVGLALVAASSPLAAWSVSGLETGVVTAFVTLAVVAGAFERPRLAAALSGLGAAFRPELLPFAIVLSVAPRGALKEASQAGAPRRAETGARLLLAATPFAVVALVRMVAFGRFAPLSVIAKAPDAELGARYAIACFLLTGPIALLAPRVWRRLPPWPRAIVLAVAAHFVAVALAGGDWMPLSRLVVPVLPAAAYAAAHVATLAAPWATALRVSLALAGEVYVTATVGPAAAGVMKDRLALIEELSPLLASSKCVATVDIGWVGAATESEVLDLAGVTDPVVAVLPGGHTSKRIPIGLFSARGVDTMVLLLRAGTPLGEPWTASIFDRFVEGWLATVPGIGEEFQVIGVSTRSSLKYVVLRRVGE